MEENRKIREELEQLQKICAEQSDKLLAYETYVSTSRLYTHIGMCSFVDSYVEGMISQSVRVQTVKLRNLK